MIVFSSQCSFFVTPSPCLTPAVPYCLPPPKKSSLQFKKGLIIPIVYDILNHTSSHALPQEFFLIFNSYENFM